LKFPQIQNNRICANTIPVNTMESNNTNQNTSGSYQPDSSVVSTQLPSNRQTNVVTQDAIGFGMNASNRGNKNGLIHFQSHFEFEKLTFYKVLHEVIKPTLLSNLPKYIL